MSPVASVLLAPGLAASPGTSPTGTAQAGPVNSFSAPGTIVVPITGQSGVPTIPAVPYIGEYPTAAPEAGVPAEGAATPQPSPTPVEVAPPPRLQVPVVPPVMSQVSVSNQQGTVVEAGETEVTTVAPARPEDPRSSWGWVGAVTAVVAGAYWMAYRYWRRVRLTATRRRAPIWQGSIFSTDPTPRW